MKDYKRLTKRDGNIVRHVEPIKSSHLANRIEEEIHKEVEIKTRLADLEDKIERGEIDYVADKDKEIARLTAENDKLRARLENAVELKAKVGDTIYMPWVYGGNYDIAKLQIIEIGFRKNRFFYITDLESDNAYYLEKYKLGIFRNEDFDNMVFTDYDKAEAKLKEIGGDAE